MGKAEHTQQRGTRTHRPGLLTVANIRRFVEPSLNSRVANELNMRRFMGSEPSIKYRTVSRDTFGLVYAGAIE